MAIAASLSLIAFSCLEDKGFTDIVNGNGNDKVFLSWYGTKGTSNNQSVLLPSGETVSEYVVGISATSSRKLNAEITASVRIDQHALDVVNSSRPDKFFLLPDSTYDIPSLSVTIPGDTTEAPFVIKFYQDKIDKSKNFMLPLTIEDKEGTVVGSNVGTLKLAFIGNPIAGAYTRNYTRWNNSTGTGSPSATSTEVTPFLPVTTTTVQVQSGYGAQVGFNARYLISFTNNGGVLSNFTVKINPDDVKDSFQPSGIVLTEDATVLQADPVAKRFKFTYKVVNSAGSVRLLTDEFVQ